MVVSIKIGLTDNIPEGEARSFQVQGVSLFVVHKDGEYFAYVNACPHLGIQLECQANQFLDSEKSFIICSNHGALFEILTGYCVSGPCHGQKLMSIACEVRAEGLYIDSGDLSGSVVR